MQPAKSFFETDAALLTPELEQDFFSSLMMSNGTYKTTFRQRFGDTNPRLIEQLAANMHMPLQVLDLGISYGLATAELYADLQAAGFASHIVATDMLVDACLVRALPGCYVLLDEDGFPLRLDLPWGSMKPWVVPGDYRSGRFIYRKIVNKVLTHCARRKLGRNGETHTRHVKLVSPRLLANSDITVCTDDLCRYNKAFVMRFELIRAANLLNKGYFSDDILARMIVHIKHYLRAPGAHLFVVRTHQDNSNHGTLFRLDDDQQLVPIWRMGQGSEVEEIVVNSADRVD